MLHFQHQRVTASLEICQTKPGKWVNGYCPDREFKSEKAQCALNYFHVLIWVLMLDLLNF